VGKRKRSRRVELPERGRNEVGEVKRSSEEGERKGRSGRKA